MPPTTDLDNLVRHLSGRGAQGRASSEPLDEASDDAAQVLAEVRRRTRALLEGPPDADGADPDWDPGRSALGVTGPRPAARPALASRRSGVLPSLALVLLGAVGMLAVDRAWRRAERLGADGATREVRQGLAAIQARLAAPGAGVAPAGDQALGDLGARLDARLAALDERLARLDREPASPDAMPARAGTKAPASPDPAVAALGADLAALRRELASSEAATAGHLQEMRSILQQVNTEVRRVLSRPEPTSTAGLTPALPLAIQALVHNLQHPSAQVRGEAAEQLARLGPTARQAIPALRDRFGREPDQNVRNTIETALTILSSP